MIRFRSRGAVALAAAGLLSGSLAGSAEPAAAPVPTLEWAYPPVPPLPPLDDTVPRQVPGSARRYTLKQIEDDFNAPDWFPERHPPAPAVVTNGRRPLVRACMKCHLPNGGGHPESSDLEGLSVAYIRQQMAAFRDGDRSGPRSGPMLPIAREVIEEELAAAARYFSELAPVPRGWRQVIETDVVPQTRLGIGGMRYLVEGSPGEPIGQRIIEVPQQPEPTELRADTSGFIAYVPRGSLARGKALVESGAGKAAIACAGCHGTKLSGNDPLLVALGEVPSIVGRSPIYLLRQLNDFKTGARKGAAAASMQQVAAQLEIGDMIAITAYLSTLQR